ncbi:MAG: NAD(P)-dependent oxidoreductase [Sphingomonadales bacterium]|nr:NAD(P)-dependent oxidoreductase [Sphingomonadales bacterium]
MIGFIGLGSQGGPMAARIAKAGLPLHVWARRSEALVPFVELGARAVPAIADLGPCEHVGICVINDSDVRAVCAELLPAMRPGSRIAIHSTVLPETVIALAAEAQTRGIALIDAPVSGGAPGAEAGTLTVMCGSDEAAFTAARPVFACFGKLIVRLGEVGAGQRAKIINNALLAANMGVAHGAITAAAALGIDRAMLAALIAQSSGRSFGFEIAARLPSPSAFATGAPLLAKDVGLLAAILPEHSGARLLGAAADDFLKSANTAQEPQS